MTNLVRFRPRPASPPKPRDPATPAVATKPGVHVDVIAKAA